MSDPNTSQDQPVPSASHEASYPGVPEHQAAQGSQATQGAPGTHQTLPMQANLGAAAPQKNGPRLSTFLKVSIILLAGLTIASISLLFIGDFEGKFERVFSTFVLFAVFVLFTAIDTRRGQKSEWYAPVALIANAYILALLLIVIWMTPYTSYGLMFEIFWKSLLVIAVTRLVIVCCQLLLKTGNQLPAVVTRFAFITSVLAVLAGILFTAPVGIEAFDLTVPDVYWKISTALLILTALGLSITLLLRWSYGAGEREAAREADRLAAAAGYGAGSPYRAQAAPGYPVQPQAAVPQGAALLPWPTFADGRPLPAGPDGQPDFSVPGAPLR
ncbi:hypothetical protein JOF28_002253 [Leucobacter exalbidus]|uniref:Uncharacterized protein n=1 Tax=Leucobacter exalbidus TaxID=662960 RepID=A0A940PXQ1_9MICO|nr:hypothetical protein [Leucobacter exalbidus]MBP1327021.1 hypothetical protein [Leucobacter exalbidus]